ncbi:MAG: hypothetical protein HY821_17145 [Acidobacteria bacterium]|nr:hypothetical protein [Acidobacteriota bacterium]
MITLRNTCALGLALAAGIAAQVDPYTPVLRPGVSVEMAVTKNAVPLPQADANDARVVAVTASGKVYLDVTAVRTEELASKLKGTANIFVKADSHAAFAVVYKVLEAMRQAGLDQPLLLTSQSGRPEAGRPVPPAGLAVHTGAAAGAGNAMQVALRAPALATFGDVVRIIDACRGERADVFLTIPSPAR